MPEMEIVTTHPSQVQQDNRLKWQAFLFSKSVRLVVGVLSVIVCVALGFRILTTTSIKGVVNAPMLLIQSPIDGTVTMVGHKAGKTIGRGEILFRIKGEHLDSSNLARVRSEEEQSQAAANGLQILVQEYTQERSGLDVRLKDHLSATKRNITQKLKEATQQQERAAEGEAQASRDFQRQKDLAGKGLDSTQAWELSRMRWTQAGNEKNAWEAIVGRNVAELEANGQGILLDGYSGTPYAQQRIDELAMRLAEARAKLDQEEKRQVALAKELQAQESLVKGLSEATIVSPSLSLVQAVRVSKGSDVEKGTVLCELVDCDNFYVEASFPEKDFDKVRLGQKATVYLYGNHLSIPGVIISVRGAGAHSDNNAEKSPTTHILTTPDSMIVNVAISADDLVKTFGSLNQVGRTARVVLSKN